MMINTPLPGLENIPVSYGTSQIPLNVGLPRPVPTGFGLSKFFGARPPWPSTPYGYQHKPLGAIGQATQVAGGFLMGAAGGYLMTVAQLYVFSRIFDLELKPKTLWLGALVYYGLQMAATLVTGAIAYGAVASQQNQ